MTIPSWKRTASIGAGVAAVILASLGIPAHASASPLVAVDHPAISTRASGPVEHTRDEVIATRAAPTSPELSAIIPSVSPPGANDFSCVPSRANLEPVVLVHGTFDDSRETWSTLSADLVADGHCVFTLDYGGYSWLPANGIRDITVSAGQLATFVAAVRESTGAAQVDLVGYSQGGLLSRYYVQKLDGAASVDHLIGLAPPNHGTSYSGYSLFDSLTGSEQRAAFLYAACTQQRAGSEFLADLNSHGDTVPGVRYVTIVSRYDEVITPYTSSFLTGETAVNRTIQNRCPGNRATHDDLPYDPIVSRWVRNALDRPTSVPPVC